MHVNFLVEKKATTILLLALAARDEFFYHSDLSTTGHLIFQIYQVYQMFKCEGQYILRFRVPNILNQRQKSNLPSSTPVHPPLRFMLQVRHLMHKMISVIS